MYGHEIEIVKYVSTCENENEIVVEVRELRIVVKVLPNVGLMSRRRRMGNLALQ